MKRGNQARPARNPAFFISSKVPDRQAESEGCWAPLGVCQPAKGSEPQCRVGSGSQWSARCERKLVGPWLGGQVRCLVSHRAHTVYGVFTSKG